MVQLHEKRAFQLIDDVSISYELPVMKFSEHSSEVCSELLYFNLQFKNECSNSHMIYKVT